MTMEELREKARLTEDELLNILGDVILSPIPEDYERHNPHMELAKAASDAQQEKDFSTPIPKECPSCHGSKVHLFRNLLNTLLEEPCPTCKGTGKVSTTLKELVEEYLK